MGGAYRKSKAISMQSTPIKRPERSPSQKDGVLPWPSLSWILSLMMRSASLRISADAVPRRMGLPCRTPCFFSPLSISRSPLALHHSCSVIGRAHAVIDRLQRKYIPFLGILFAYAGKSRAPICARRSDGQPLRRADRHDLRGGRSVTSPTARFFI